MLASTVFLHCRTVGCELPEGVLRCGYNYHAMLEGLQVRNALNPAQSWEIYNLINLLQNFRDGSAGAHTHTFIKYLAMLKSALSSK